jgi:ion channel-forming bestrophin family protein
MHVGNRAVPSHKLVETDALLYCSVVMGVLLVFRLNSAYERWWEGRKLWGQLVNDTRNFCLKTATMIHLDKSESQQLANLLCSFPVALKDHLRTVRTSVKLEGATGFDTIEHTPMYIAKQVYKRIRKWKTDNRIDSIEVLQLDTHARALMDICGASERIMKSPISGTFKYLIWYGLTLYFLVLPWALFPLIEDGTMMIVHTSAYFVFALELGAEELEHPFGISVNDLPLESICQSIEKSVYEALELERSAAT